jgi:hypothetical protein
MPASARSRPFRQRRSVVFPVPDSPMMATDWPGETVSDSSAKRVRLPKRLVMPWALSMLLVRPQGATQPARQA